MKKLKLLLADDHPLFLEGLVSLIKAEKNFAPPLTASNGDEVIRVLDKQACDMCILDINMPGLNGLEAAKTVRSRWPEIKVIILTTYNDREFISEMLAVGVSGYVLKNSTRTELVKAIYEVSAGKTFFSTEVQDSIFNDYTSKVRKEKSAAGTEKVVLTPRETEIVRLLAREYTNDRIAEELHISYRTVETHRKNIMQKTKSANLAGLLKFAYTNGIIS
jgi:DNA-binding NarL/FixJ family response regulator